MSKKIIIALTIFITFLGFNFANANEINILPNNPLYFFKDLGRKIQDFFTFDNVKKVELRINVANEKLTEIEQMVSKNLNIPDYGKYFKKYEEAVLKVHDKIKTIDKEDVLEKATKEVVKQEERLNRLKDSLRINIDDFINKEDISALEQEEVYTDELITNRVIEGTKEFGITTKDVLKTMEVLSEEDMKLLEQFAMDILSGNKTEKDVEKIELSDDARKKIMILGFPKFCADLGYELLVEDDLKFCISPLGIKCTEEEFINQGCAF
ncbi:MAG: DUF5667 domain-containing protein [Candidatus Paceibacterota bacterium]